MKVSLEIKTEEKLNQDLHDVLLTAAKSDNLVSYQVRCGVVLKIKEIFKEAGYVIIKYELPLERCITCKVRKHCIAARETSCPNHLEGVKYNE